MIIEEALQLEIDRLMKLQPRSSEFTAAKLLLITSLQHILNDLREK